MNMLTLDCKIKRWSINGFTFPFQTNTFAVEAGAAIFSVVTVVVSKQGIRAIYTRKK